MKVIEYKQLMNDRIFPHLYVVVLVWDVQHYLLSWEHVFLCVNYYQFVLQGLLPSCYFYHLPILSSVLHL